MPILGFRDTYPEVFQPLVKEYQSLNEGTDSIILKHEDNFSQISYGRQKAGITIENLEDLTGFDVEINKLLNVLQQCKVENLLRLGVRTWILYALTSQDFEQSVSDLRSHQFVDGNLAMGSEDLEDFAIVLEGKHSNGQMRIQYGIMSNEEIAAKVSQFQYDGDPNVALTFDIDNYTLNIDGSVPPNLPRAMADYNLKTAASFVETHHDLFD